MFSYDKTQTEYIEQIFRDLNLSRQEVASKEFEDCTFIKCDFNETIFKKCKFLNCKFKNCDLSLIKIKYCSFVNAVFEDSKVIGVNWSEVLCQTSKISATIRQFLRCIISHSTFMGMSLRDINIKECLARDVDFRETDLTRADLTHTDFIASLFLKTNLTEANFTNSRNYNINPALNTIEKAKFSLPEAISLLYSLNIVLVD